jgi:hypothetical protein
VGCLRTGEGHVGVYGSRALGQEHSCPSSHTLVCGAMSGQVPGQWATQRPAAATSAETGANYYAPRPRKEEVVDGSDDSADSESESLSDEEDEQSWITWFCSLKGNEFFVEVSALLRSAAGGPWGSRRKWKSAS